MHFLHLELERNEDLYAVVSGLSERIAHNMAKMGLMLDLNPIWLEAFRIDDAGLNSDNILSDPYFSYLRFTSGASELLLQSQGTRLPDLDLRFDIASQLISYFFYKRRVDFEKFQPFLLRIIARPNPNPDPISGEKFEAERKALVNAARETPIPTIVETHPKPQLVGAPGSRIVSSRGVRGTLGGYLIDNNNDGATYAVTCGHVTTGSAYSENGREIGRVLYSAEPVPLPHGEPCYAECKSMTDLDIALIDTYVTPENQATTIAEVVGNGQIVEMQGASSGTRTYVIGGAFVDHEIEGVCWKKLFQLRASYRGILPAWIKLAMNGPPKPGDSGAWIIRDDFEWAGMVVASNPIQGYALSSSDMLRKANEQFQTNLVLAPDLSYMTATPRNYFSRIKSRIKDKLHRFVE